MQIESPSIPQAKPIWGAGLTVVFGLAIFIGYAIVQGIVAAFFALDQLTADPNVDLVQLAQKLSSNGLMISISTVLSAIAGVGLICLVIKVRKGLSIQDYLELKHLTGKMIILLCALGFLLVSVSAIINLVSGISEDSGFTVQAYQSSVWPWLFGVAVVIFAPAFEETFFRGFLFAGLSKSRLGVTGTIIITALIWSVLHLQYDLYGMGTILVLGIVLGYVRFKTGSLWGSLVIHSFWNLLTFISITLVVNGIIK